MASPSHLSPFVGALLVIYPVYDLVAIAVDARLSGPMSPRRVLYFNFVVSAVAAVALGIAATSGIPASLRVFGIWAIVAGVAQVVVGLARRALGGQMPMLLSGGISVLAGISFVAKAASDNPSLSVLGEYAILGALFFLVSSILLRRRNA